MEYKDRAAMKDSHELIQTIRAEFNLMGKILDSGKGNIEIHKTSIREKLWNLEVMIYNVRFGKET